MKVLGLLGRHESLNSLFQVHQPSHPDQTVVFGCPDWAWATSFVLLAYNMYRLKALFWGNDSISGEAGDLPTSHAKIPDTCRETEFFIDNLLARIHLMR